MSPTAEELLAIARAVAAEAVDSDLSFVASGLAYYSLMAVTPALVMGFLLLVELGGQALAGHVVESTASVLSTSGQRFIRDSMRQMNARSGVMVVAVGLSLWGARRLYRGWIRASGRSRASTTTPSTAPGTRSACSRSAGCSGCSRRRLRS